MKSAIDAKMLECRYEQAFDQMDLPLKFFNSHIELERSTCTLSSFKSRPQTAIPQTVSRYSMLNLHDF
ncbi:hypothetical protein Pan54_10690 [Rubinisphaera italica]|uniref:Uncharacterized protein n=1 Tax=Rubinisphaera italica TaxID=2527969 RepID=A0A5C5XE04_9PLAN|nr:hypothetical protein Pan54_10690 [Rubinisphaera italica]